jgi:hypothetical protein
MDVPAQATIAIYEDLALALGDRVLTDLGFAALAAAEAQAQLREPTGHDRAVEAIDLIAAEIERADRDLRNSLAAISLARAASGQTGT